MPGITGEDAERIFDRFMDGYFRVMGDLLLQSDQPASEEADIKEQSPEFQNGIQAIIFLLQVVIPCALQSRTTPARLLTRARRGDQDALSVLLQIDSTVLVDPDISRHLMSQPNGNIMLKEAIDTVPKLGSDYQWKARMAAALREIAKQMEVVLRHEDIIDLFHAFAKDFDGLEHGDPDMGPTEYRAFEKRVNVEKKFWQDNPSG